MTLKIGCTFDLKAPTTQCAKIPMCQNVQECQKCKILTTFWGKCANLTISQSHPPGSSSEKCSRTPFLLPLVTDMHYFCSYSNTTQTKLHVLSFVTDIHYFWSHPTTSRKQNFRFLSLESDDEGDSLGPLVVHLLLQGRDAVSSLLAHDCVRVPACGFKRCLNMRVSQESVRSFHCSGEEDHLNTFNFGWGWYEMDWSGKLQFMMMT